MTVYHALYGLIAVVAIIILYLIRSVRRIPRHNFGEAEAQPPAGNAPAGATPVVAVQAQNAGDNQRRLNPYVGFSFFIAAALAFPAAYFLPYPWNGMAFITIATAAFFIKMRYGTKKNDSWGDVWDWLTKEISVYGRDPNGRVDRKQIVGVSNSRISGFVVAEAFALALFEAFFGYVIPNYPSVVLAFFMAILWFIGTGAAESLIDRIARYFSYTLVTTIAGSTVVITLYLFYFKHIEQRMISVAFVALVLGMLGIYLRYRKSKEVKRAGLILLIVGGIGLTAVATNIVSSLGDIPAKQAVDQVREYQRGEREDIKVRFLPKSPTATTPAPQVQTAPAPAPPVQTQSPATPTAPVTSPNPVPTPSVASGEGSAEPQAQGNAQRTAPTETASLGQEPPLSDEALRRLAEELGKNDDELYKHNR